VPPTAAGLCALREAVARIERSGEAAGRGSARRRVPLADEPLALDAALGGGLCCGTLHEVMAASARDVAAAAGFAVSLAVRCADDRPLIWVVDDRVVWETGLPYRPGLASHGLDPEKLILVRTRDARATLWAAEEALRVGAGVVLTEMWRGQCYDLTASRRLLLAARRGGATSLLLHVGLDEDALSSAADVRFVVAARPGEVRASAGGRIPVPGPAGFAVRLLKRRGGAQDKFGGFDRDDVHALAWDRVRGAFRALRDADALRHAPLEPSRHDQPTWLGQGGAA
jgi:protein ImuA